VCATTVDLAANRLITAAVFKDKVVSSSCSTIYSHISLVEELLDRKSAALDRSNTNDDEAN
jgi:hypothetical protein